MRPPMPQAIRHPPARRPRGDESRLRPRRRPPAPEEALVRVEAAGVNFIDTYHRTGLYPIPLPFTPGVEGAGVVEAVGAGVFRTWCPATGSAGSCRWAATPKRRSAPRRSWCGFRTASPPPGPPPRCCRG